MNITYKKIADGSIQECYANGELFAEIGRIQSNMWHGMLTDSNNIQFARPSKRELAEVLLEEFIKRKQNDL